MMSTTTTTIEATTAAARASEPRPGVLERITQIMDCLAEAPGRLPLEEVAAITGIPRSTTFRMLSQLVDLGWADHGPSGFGIGPRLGSRGASADLEELRSHACPVLNVLAAETGSVAHLGVMHGAFVHYLDKIGGGVAASVPSQIGTRIFAPEAGCGLAILACLEWDDVVSLLEHAGRSARFARDGLQRELADARHRGYAYRDGGRRASGVSSVGAAIIGPAGPVAAISVARRGAIPVRAVGPVVARAAESISVALFGHWRGQGR